MTFTECQSKGAIFMKKKIKVKLPKGKFSTMYYCGDCRHLDRRDVTKDGTAAYCKLHRTYRCFDKDYGCSDWKR